MPTGLLLVGFDFTNAHDDEFHDWYDLEHVPERERVPGFNACNRWISVANPKQAVATYELDSLDVLQSPAYRAIGGENLSVWSKRVTAMCARLIRFEGEQILPGSQAAPEGAGGLLVNAMNVDPEHEAEFNEWYDHEHIPALSAVPGTLCARRFRDSKGTHRYLALYHLASPDVPTTPAWQKAANSPWTDRLRPHFRNHLRIVSRCYVRGG
ncbi:MAG TPA: hypothetical protein VMU81_13765 [Acetobacteraceae bacterium]|nr:hypothetical protein [Acetobacteraceae bacterium]